MRDVFKCLAGFGDEFLDLVQVDFAIGIDIGLAVGLTVEHILIHMGVHLDVAALGLELHIIEI